MKPPLAALLLTALLQSTAGADIKLNGLFADDMVLQRGKPVPVWGVASPGEKLKVEFAGQKKSAVADAAGNWRVNLDPLPATAEPRDLVVTGLQAPPESRKVSGVLVGEVWVCAGQSNMERQLGPREGQKPLDNWEAEAASANYPLIRHFAVARKKSDVPLADTEGRWEICSPATVPNFTAVGYYFGRDLYKKLKVPIGLIHTSWGGTPAEAWTRREALEQSLPEIIEAQRKAVEDFPARLAKYQSDEVNLIAAWEKASQEAKDAGRRPPQKPRPPENPVDSPKRPAGLYNAMVAPLIPYAIQGVIWYQGEANREKAGQYRSLFPLMISEWRKAWGEGDFPFLFVQIAPHKGMMPEIREAQLLTWKKVPNTAMAVTVDVGDAEDIHPTRKEPVGERLALAARALAYGEKLEYSGPVYDSMKIDGSAVTISFSHVGKGLVARGGELKGFSIAGEDGRFVPADASIRDKTVRLSSPQVAAPVAVRYGWANVPDVNLFNLEGLPASPFRTDVDGTTPAKAE